MTSGGEAEVEEEGENLGAGKRADANLQDEKGKSEGCDTPSTWIPTSSLKLKTHLVSQRLCVFKQLRNGGLALF
jgi:hypothetical protein